MADDDPESEQLVRVPPAASVHEARRFVRVASPLSDREEQAMRRTIGAAMAVHRSLGAGFIESIYRRAMCVELACQGLEYETERGVRVTYRDVEVGRQRVDLIVAGMIVVEVKAVSRLAPVHRAQTISYLKATRLRGGLVINFRVAQLRDGLMRVVL